MLFGSWIHLVSFAHVEVPMDLEVDGDVLDHEQGCPHVEWGTCDSELGSYPGQVMQCLGS